jgi:hypothetical protein
MTITAPINFEISSDAKTWASSIKLSPTLGKLAQITISIRPISTLKAGTYAGDIMHTTQGATTLIVTVKSMINLPLAAQTEVNTIISIVPNPVQDVLKVNHPVGIHANLIIYTLMGTKISTHIVQAGADNTQLNVSTLPNGTYLLHYLSDKTNEAVKFIKQP